MKQTADKIAPSGLAAAGYQYVNIDDCWMQHSRDASWNLQPDYTKFPDGISGTAVYLHSKGLKLGIYEDAGTATCAGYPGSLGHESQDRQRQRHYHRRAIGPVSGCDGRRHRQQLDDRSVAGGGRPSLGGGLPPAVDRGRRAHAGDGNARRRPSPGTDCHTDQYAAAPAPHTADLAA